MPSFSFKTLEGNDFTKESITKDKNTVFIYFNSECEHCKYEALAINKNLDKFINTQIVFISFESVKEIKVFADKYHFLDKKNVLFLSDYNSNFSEIFDAHHIPYTLIYNKHQKLVKNYKGEVKIEAILKHLVVK
ncbi:MAG: redoxin domain-containing protein [Urechidicola sp.]|nr:redoxin domain-containing protein [Urechidicola sp.]